jgi:hypothetical protein
MLRNLTVGVRLLRARSWAFSAVVALAASGFSPVAFGAGTCTEQEFMSVEKFFENMGEESFEFTMQIGGDGHSQLETIRKFSAAKPVCWNAVLKHEGYAEKLETFRKYVASPAPSDHDIPEAKCKPWISERLANQKKHYQIGENCYAHALADQFSHQFDEDISAWELWARYANDGNMRDEFHRRNVENDELSLGGTISEALQSTRLSETGLCLASNFDETRAHEVGMVVREIMKEKNASKIEALLIDKRSLFKKLTGSDIKAIVAEPRKLARMHKLFERSCKERSYGQASPLHSIRKFFYDESAHGRLMDLVDSTLNHQQPAAITYQAKGFGGSFLKTGVKTKHRPGSKQDHGSSIVGRRYLNGRCEYLVKDSATVDCNQASKSYECDEKTGNVWVPRTVLANSVLGVERLESGSVRFNDKAALGQR